MDRLTEAELATMRAEHVPDDSDLNEAFCSSSDCRGRWRHWPCHAAILLAHFAPGLVPHLAGIAAKVE